MRTLALLAVTSAFGVAVIARPAAGQGALQPVGPPCPSRVMTFYYGWYGAPPGWSHWADPDPTFSHDPSTIVATGSRYPGGVKRDVAATDYPLEPGSQL